MSHGPAAPSPVRGGWWMVGLTLLAGVAITLVVWQRTIERQVVAVRDQFQREAATLRANIVDELRITTEVLDSIRALHAVSDEIHPAALEEFVQRGMAHQRAILGGFGFAQRISHPLRRALEEAYREAPATGYLIREWNESDFEVVPAVNRPVYFPLTWQTDDEILHVPVGFDLAAFSAAAEAIQQMVERRGAVLVPRPIPVASPPQHWIFSPIFQRTIAGLPEVADRPLLGFAVGLLHIDILRQRAKERSGLPDDLHFTLMPVADDDIDPYQRVGTPPETWHYLQEVAVLDQTWALTVERTGPVAPARAWGVWAAGFSITGLVASQLVLLIGRQRRIAQEVQTRTAELETANRQLADEMRERSRLEHLMGEARSRERRQLGRDLHDSLGQKLAGAVYLSRSLVRRVEPHDPDGADHARQLNATLKEAVQQVRGLARGLAPVDLQGEGLGDALHELAKEVAGVFSVDCTVSCEPSLSWPTAPHVAEPLYFIAREAAYNAARHGKPQHIDIKWQPDDHDGVAMIIEDDGTGLPVPVPSGGLGLQNMRHRAELLQGILEWADRPPHGVRVIGRFPRTVMEKEQP